MRITLLLDSFALTQEACDVDLYSDTARVQIALTFFDAAFAANVVTETALVTSSTVEIGATLLEAVTRVNQFRFARALGVVNVRSPGVTCTKK